MDDHAPLLERAFDLEPAEAQYFLSHIDGELPPDLAGTYFLNGPGRFHNGAQTYRHWLDGDGRVSSLRFAGRSQGGDGRVQFTSRFVRSDKYVAEEEAGRARFRTFGTHFEGDELVRGMGLASPVNVSVYRHAGKLLAFGEQGLPWELDEASLETLGEHTFGRRLNPVSPFAAHPNFDLATGEMLNFGISFAKDQPALHLYRFNAQAELVLRKRQPLDAPRSVHDFGLSRRYAIFYLSPYLLDMEAFMKEGATLQDGLRWRPEVGSRLLLLGREDGEVVCDLEIGDRYCLHLIGCFEQDGLLFVDLLELDRPVYDQYEVPYDLFKDVRRARPVRYVVDPAAGRLLRQETIAHQLMGDFPTVDPRQSQGDYRQFWYLAISKTEQPGRKFFDQLVRGDWRQRAVVDTYQAPPFHYLCGEPVFLPAAGSDPSAGGGFILCQSFDAQQRSGSFVLFDAFDLAAGPRAVLHLEEPIHFGFHAAFYPQGGW